MDYVPGKYSMIIKTSSKYDVMDGRCYCIILQHIVLLQYMKSTDFIVLMEGFVTQKCSQAGALSWPQLVMLLF
jgi:hypothetical protein